MMKVGIDVGSTYTKYCIETEHSDIVSLFKERTPVRQREYLQKKTAALIEKYGDISIVSCGYGKENVNAVKCMNELTALAKGGYRLLQADCAILDIGGQDTKIIYQERGQLKKFFVNDRCAAGCGMFFLNILNLLQLNYQDVHLSGNERPKRQLSSVCAVFAQSEIVQLLADNVPEQEIICSVLYQIFTQAKMLLGKMPVQSLLLSGGLSQIDGITEFASNVLECEVYSLKEAAYLSAIGCCQA